MSTGDWIAVGTVLVAVVTVGVMYWAGTMQRSSAQDDLQDQFNQLINSLTKLHAEAGELLVQPLAALGSPAQAKVLGIGSQLQVVGGQAHKMLEPEDKTERRPELDWFSAYILAMTFDQAWHLTRGQHYWDRAVELSKAEPQAEVVALLGRARHFYGRNDPGDCDLARLDHRAALDLVDEKIQGHDVSYHQRAQIRLDSVMAEQTVGNGPEMLKAIWLCWDDMRQIHTLWRLQACANPLFGFIERWGLLPMLLVSPEHTQAEKDALQMAINQWHMELAYMRMQQQHADGAPDGSQYGQSQRVQPGQARPGQEPPGAVPDPSVPPHFDWSPLAGHDIPGT